MKSYDKYYEEKLYPFQDGIMRIVNGCKTPFYLTGGTALSRFYFHHRYSDDLDYFLARNQKFHVYVEQVFKALSENQEMNGYTIDYNNIRKHDDFVQLFLIRNDTDQTTLKIDMVNDIDVNYGRFLETQFGMVDAWENILSNKLSALYRLEAKDVTDIWIIAKNKKFQWKVLVDQAASKDAGVDPMMIAEILQTFPVELLNKVKWAISFETGAFIRDIHTIAHDLILGKDNSLFNQ